MLVSLHMPKTAGTSFLATLEEHFGSRLRQDYEDRPLHNSAFGRRRSAAASALRSAASGSLEGVDCIHGHFLPLKYRLLRGPKPISFVTWLRDPVERLASHYHYWKRSYDPSQSGPLHRRMMDEDWDMERFCLGAELRNLYSEFLWGFPLTRFTFIGITECYGEDLNDFAAAFLGGAGAGQADRNVNDARPEETYISDTGFRRAIERHHQRDMALYRQGLALREERRGARTDLGVLP